MSKINAREIERLNALLEKERLQSLDLIREQNTRIDNLSRALEAEKLKSERILSIAIGIEFDRLVSSLSFDEKLHLFRDDSDETVLRDSIRKSLVKDMLTQFI